MTTTDQINDPDGFRYFDENQLIDYLFIGFDKPLTKAERLSLITSNGSPRKSPLNAEYGPEGIKIIFEKAASRIETQMIMKSLEQE